MLVYISVYISSRRCVPQDDKSAVSSDRRESRDLNHASITNIPDPGHKKGLFSGRRSHFAILGQENDRFSGQEKKKHLQEMLKFQSYRSSRRFAPQDDREVASLLRMTRVEDFVPQDDRKNNALQDDRKNNALQVTERTSLHGMTGYGIV